MINDIRPHSEYKCSSLAWLGRIPKHWREEPGFGVFREKQEKNTGLREKRVLSLSYGRVVIKPEERLRGLIPESFDTYQIVNPGDLVIRGTDLQNDWTSLRVGYVRDRGIITSAYLCLQNLGLFNPEYAFLVLHAYDLQKFFYGLGSGLRQNLSFHDFRRLPFPIPPLEEQAAIVRFVDHANRRIERFIRSKRKLIALLNEQKQAIIHRAVTRGLDPNVPMKDSGVPWLPQIPAAWRASRLKFETTDIVDCLHATPRYAADGEYPAIRTADIEPGKVRLAQARRISRQDFERWTARLEPRAGDILYSREGERFGIAAPVPKEVRLCISQRMMVFRVRDSQDAAYIMWQLNCPHVYAQASVYIIGSTSPHVNVEQIRNFQIALPPVHEQRLIAAHIVSECADLDAVRARTEREIALIREYRTRLISDVVTGQLDVREAASKLPPDKEPSLPDETEPAADEDVDTEDGEAT